MINSYGRQDLTNLSIKKFNIIKKINIVTNGIYCEKFEKEISKTVNSKYAVVCNNGTSAIFLAILALNLRGIVAIVPNINFVAVASIIKLLKGKLILCDVNPENGMVDLYNFQQCLKNCKKKNISPNLFVPIHYAGDVLELKKISMLCMNEKIKIIEDGCHSFGSSKIINNELNTVGSCKHSLMTTFSFHPVKNITTLEGGAVTTNNKKIYKSLVSLRSHALKITSIEDPYTLTSPSLNFRMPEINALIGLDQIKKLQKFKSIRNKIIRDYLKEFKIFQQNFKILNFNNDKIFWHLFVIFIKKISIKKKLMLFLKKNGIGTQVHYKPISYHKVYTRDILLSFSNNSSLFYKSQLSLPLHVNINSNNIKKIVNKFKKFFKNEKI